MQIKIALLAMTLLSACGAADQAAAPADEAVASKAASKQTDEQPADEKTLAPAAAEAQQSIRLLQLAADLPACKEVDEGLTYYIVEDQSFQACIKGAWTAIDLKGADGKDGLDGAATAKGDKGDPGADGATGATGPQGATGATGPQGNPGAAGAAGAAGATGATGAAGAAGAAGSNGSAGAAGAAGAAGSNGTNGKNAGGYYTAADVYLGGAISSDGTVLLSDGAVTRFNIDGTPATPWGGRVTSSGITTLVQATCSFTTNNCSGTCWATYGFSTTTGLSGLVKNSAFYTGSAWRKASGAETSGGSQLMRSSIDADGSCNTGHASWTAPATFAPAAAYTLPAGITLPLGNLYLGAGQ